MKKVNHKKGVSATFVIILCLMVLPYSQVGLSNGSTSDWPMYRHDVNRSGYTLVIGPKYNFTKWTFQTGAPVLPTPAVVNGIVYIGSNDSNVYALDMWTGEEIWNYSTGPGGIHTSPAVANDIIYIGANDNKTYALNATTGELKWSFTAYGAVYLGLPSPFWSSPIVVDGIVYIGNQDSVVYALNATTGTVVWAQTVYGACTGSSPAVVEGRLYIGTAGYVTPYPGNVTCLNATTGTLIWNYTVSPGVYFSSPAIVDDVVYVGTFGGFVLALNATTGELLSSFNPNPIPINTSPAVANGVVYVGSGDGKIYALDASNLTTVKWSKTLSTITYPFGGVYSSPIVAGDAVYIGTDDGKLFALNAATGTEIWTYKTEGFIRGSYAVVSGAPDYPSMLFMGSYDGKIYAIYDVNHDIAINDVIPLKTIVGQTFTCRINVTVTNKGNYTETFNVAAYYNETAISIHEQWPNSTQSQTFWSSGDVNKDGYIDDWDLALIVASYGWVGPPGENPADIDSNGIVNMADAYICSQNYGFDIWATLGIPGQLKNQTIVTLPPGNSTTIMFRWAPSTMVKGNYTIRAYAEPVLGETDILDNNFTDGWVFVAIVGDVNGDKKVDMVDLWEVARHFGINYPDPRYKPNFDIDYNTKIDMIDLWTTAKEYGKIDP